MVASSQTLSAALTGLALFSAVQAQHVSNKNTLFDGLSNINKQGLFDAYPRAAVTKNVKRPWGTLPQFCYQATNPDNLESGGKFCNPYDIETYEVTFADCAASFLLCRCNNGPWSVDDMLDTFGRIPILSRQYTQALIVLKDTSTHAYSYNQHIAVFDTPAKGGKDMTLFFHENGHSVDAGSGGLSSKQAFIDAINKDSCVPDGYAKSNDVEDWAQLMVLAHLDKSKTGPLSKYKNPACLRNQLTQLENSVGSDKLLPGGTCTFTYVKDPYVCMGPAAGCGRAGTIVATNREAVEESHGLPIVQAPTWGPVHDDASLFNHSH